MRTYLKWLAVCILAGIVISVVGCTQSEPGYQSIVNTPLPVTLNGPQPTVTVQPIPTPLPVVVQTPVPTVPISGTVVANVPTPLPVTIPTPVPIVQNSVYDANNSSNVNLSSGTTFTGTATLTASYLSTVVSLYATQDCIVYVDQSIDGTNWNITDTYYFYANTNSLGGSWTTQIVQEYYRVRVTNVGTVSTSTFRLQSNLDPTADPFPRALTTDGRFKVATHISDNYGFNVENTPEGELRAVSPVRLAGQPFIGTTIDPNFWLTYTANGGTLAQSGGAMTLATNTTANGAAALSTFRRAIFVPGSSMRYRSTVVVSAGATNNTRRWGIADWATLPTITDGAWFQLSGTTFSVVTMIGGVATTVSNGSFNGNYGIDYAPGTSAHTYEIYYNNFTVVFAIDGISLHTVNATGATAWSATPTLFAYADNINSGGATTNNTLVTRVEAIDRLGELSSASIYKHLIAGTTVLKYGAGHLHSLVINAQPTSIIIYDNTTASGTIIADITTQPSTVPTELDYDTDFYTGLTIVVAGGNADITVVYE